MPTSIRRDSRKWKALVERDGEQCAWCGSGDAVVDHVLPTSRGGTSDLDNLQFLCGPCNSRKGAQTNAEASKAVRHASSTEQAGYTIIPNAVLLDVRLSIGARMLYGVLKSYAWHHDSVWPGQERVAKELGVSSRTLRDYLDELIAVALVDVQRRGRGLTNVYIVKEPILRSAKTSVLDRNKRTLLDRKETTPEVNEVEEHEEEPSAAAPQGRWSKAERDLVWDGLVAVCGAPTTKSEQADFGKTSSELRAVIPREATAAEVVSAMGARKVRWSQRYPTAEFTHRVLRQHWADLGRSRGNEIRGAVQPDEAELEDDGTGRRTF